MNGLRKIVREIIKEMVISEAALTFSDIFSNENIGLVVYHDSVTLYDFQNDRVYGYMSYKPASNNMNEFVAVASEKGYGPLIYEIGIMSSFRKALLPPRDGDIRGDAFNVWQKFMDRSDVGKVVLKNEDDAYSEVYLDFGDVESVIGNTALMKTPSNDYDKLLNRGRELSKKHRISEEQVAQRGSEYFSYRYAED